MSTKSRTPKPNRFIWNELVTQDVPKAKKFYTHLFGWKTEAFKKAPGYTLFKQGKDGAGGVMKCPQAGLPSHWLPYVAVKDFEATMKKAKKLRAKVVVEPFDIPTVGRIAVLTDPQGAAIGIITPKM